VQTQGYAPAVYRDMAQEQFESANVIRRVNSVLCRWEQVSRPQPEAAVPGPAYTLPVPAPAVDYSSQNRVAAMGASEPPIHSVAEQAISVTRNLKELLRDQPSHTGLKTEHNQPPAPAQEIRFNCSQDRFSVEPFLDMEPSAVPFAR
jgi:hypothetical protein